MALISSALLIHFFFGLALAGQDETRDYTGSQVLKIQRDPKGVAESLVKEQSLDIWKKGSSHLDVLVPVESISPLKRSLRLKNIPFKTMVNDVQEAIEKEQPAGGKRAGARRMNWDQFQRLDVIHNYLDTLARTYPFVSVGVLGKSVENRPLKYIKISSGKPNAKAVFIDGGIHAREWASPSSVTYIIRELVENRSRLPRDLLDLDFYILPVVNPDGYEYSHTRDRMWRKNRSKESRCVGTDLNRNFDAHWGGKGTSGNTCSEIYRGKSPASEPETQALQRFLTSIRSNLKAYITFHTYGQYILIPYAHDYNNQAPGFSQMKRVGEQAARAIRQATGATYQVGNTADIFDPAAGGSDDWAKQKLGIPYSMTIELRDTGSYGFVLPARLIQPVGRDAWEAVKVIAAAAAKA